jgi:hypothetical protein
MDHAAEAGSKAGRYAFRSTTRQRSSGHVEDARTWRYGKN